MLIFKFKKYYYLLLFLNFCILVNAQESNYIYEALEAEITSDNAIFSMVQDDDGLLWFGTAKGLYKYNGHSYFNLKSIENDQTSLPGNAVRMVVKNSKGDIWVFGHKFLSLVNRSNHKLSHFWDNRIIGDFFPRSSCFDKKDNLWLLMLGKISKFNTIDRKWYIYNYSGTGIDSKDKIFLFYTDKEGNIWLGKNGSLYIGCQNDKSNEIRFKTFPVKSNNNVRKLHSMWQDATGNYWLGTDIGLFYKEKDGVIFSEIKFNDRLKNIKTDIYGLSEDLNNNNIWVNTIDTVFIYNINSDFIEFANIENLKVGISPLSNGKLGFHDNTGCHWLDFGLGRVYKLRHINNKFSQIKVDSDDQKSVANSPVFSIYQDVDRVYWFSSRTAVSAYYEKKNCFVKYLQDSESLSSDSNYNYYGIGGDIKGNLWVGSNYGGLFKFNKKTKEFKNYLFYPNASPFKNSNNAIRTIFTDSRGRTWFVRLFGVSLLKSNGEEFENYEFIKVPDPSLDQFHFFDIVEDDENNIWVGGGDRLFRIRNEGQIDSFIINGVNSSIFGMHFHRKLQKLFLGFSGDGLLVFDIKKFKITKVYTTKEGLATNSICCILEDNKHNLWMSTSNGISKFDINSEKFYNFDIRHGVNLRDCTTGAKLKNSNGELLFGGYHVVRFHPDSIKPDIEVKHFPIRITSIKSLGKEKYFDKTLSALKQIALKSSDSYVEIFFSCLDYRFPDERKYKYKLEGFDKDWIEAGKRNTASYANLKVGSYVFRVQSTNADGIWNPKELGIPLVIHAENITQEPWFFPFILGLVISGLVSGIIYFLVKRQKKKEANLLKEKDSLNHRVQLAGLQALRSQMNPHFLYNVLNSVNSFISKNDRNTANKFLVDFGKLMRHILDNSEKHIHSLDEELQFLRLYLDFEYMRFADIFEYNIIIENAIQLDKIFVPTMAVQPLLENAIRHGLRPKKGGGKLTLKLSIKNDVLLISITDNGIGIYESYKTKTETNHRSNGLNNIKERIDILKNIYNKNINFEMSDLTDIENKLCGTEVILTIENPAEWILE